MQPDTPKFSMNYVVEGTSYHKSITSMMLKAPPEVELAFFTICKFVSVYWNDRYDVLLRELLYVIMIQVPVVLTV